MSSFKLSDVFISYSRRDSDFVRRLDAKLREYDQHIWVDWEDIPLTADWWKEIQAGIDGANTFIFVISPDSVTSEICYKEVDHALTAGKRFVPVLHREITDPEHQKQMHPSIGSHNWIPFQDDAHFEANVKNLVDALQTDLGYVRSHTRLLVQAREWESRGRDSSFLLSGTAVREAETWLAESANMKPRPTPLHTEYIVASQQAQARRQRNILAGVSVALIVALGLAVLSFSLYRQSEANESLALTQASIAALNEALAATSADEARQQADIAATNEARANRNADLAATNESRAAANEAEALAQGTAVAHQAATSQANAGIAATNEARANRNADLAATNESRAAANEAEALAQGTAVAHQAATSQANADIAATSESRANLNADLAATSAAVARANEAEAEAQARRADVARRQAQAIALASDAEFALGNDEFEFATLVGIAALANYPYTWQAERVLGMAVGADFVPVVAYTPPDLPDDPLRSPDGVLRLVIPAELPQQAEIVRISDGAVLWTLIGHIDDITGAAWSPDGAWVATISRDATARIWNASTGQNMQTLFGHNDELTALAWSPDGSRLVTVGLDATLNIWNPQASVLPLALTLDTPAALNILYTGDSITLVDEAGQAYRWRLWQDAPDLLALARSQVARQLTDEEAAYVGLPLARSAPPPDVIAGCEDALESQLYPGVFARVSSKNNLLPLNVREGTGLDASRIARIPPDQTFQVLDGPVCQDGYAWFEVVFGLDATRGWVAEGEMSENGPDYFAEPVPGR